MYEEVFYGRRPISPMIIEIFSIFPHKTRTIIGISFSKMIYSEYINCHLLNMINLINGIIDQSNCDIPKIVAIAAKYIVF